MTRLLFQAKKKDWNPTKSDLKAVIDSLGEKLILMPLNRPSGKTATDGL
jgi:hypothetical protein